MSTLDTPTNSRNSEFCPTRIQIFPRVSSSKFKSIYSSYATATHLSQAMMSVRSSLSSSSSQYSLPTCFRNQSSTPVANINQFLESEVPATPAAESRTSSHSSIPECFRHRQRKSSGLNTIEEFYKVEEELAAERAAATTTASGISSPFSSSTPSPFPSPPKLYKPDPIAALLCLLDEEDSDDDASETGSERSLPDFFCGAPACNELVTLSFAGPPKATPTSATTSPTAASRKWKSENNSGGKNRNIIKNSKNVRENRKKNSKHSNKNLNASKKKCTSVKRGRPLVIIRRNSNIGSPRFMASTVASRNKRVAKLMRM